jgi:hypothetical protein
MSYTGGVIRFFPRLPTKQALEARPFQDQYSLKSVVEALKAKREWRFLLRGYLTLWKPQTESWNLPQIPFSGPADLERILEEMKWDAAAVYTIHLPEFGWFRVRDSDPPKREEAALAPNLQLAKIVLA